MVCPSRHRLPIQTQRHSVTFSLPVMCLGREEEGRRREGERGERERERRETEERGGKIEEAEAEREGKLAYRILHLFDKFSNNKIKSEFGFHSITL